MGFISSLFARKTRKSALDGNDVSSMDDRQIISICHRLLGQNEAARALQLLRHAVKVHPGSLDLEKLRQKVERSVNQPLVQEALEQLDEYVTEENCLRLADLHLRMGETREAIHFGNLAIQTEPESVNGYRVVGRIYLGEFRDSGDTIAGMNALRYVVKAHNLAPHDSRTLLELTEIFAILRAPLAARRFLNPVKLAFPDDPSVLQMESWLTELAPENTTQIQELFLRYEQEVVGIQVSQEQLVQPDRDLLQYFVDEAASLMGGLGFYLLNPDRQILAGFNQAGWTEDDFGEHLGLLDETARQNSERMNLGKFGSLSFVQDDMHVLMRALGHGVTAFLFGAPESKPSEMAALLDRFRDRFESFAVSGGQN